MNMIVDPPYTTEDIQSWYDIVDKVTADIKMEKLIKAMKAVGIEEEDEPIS